MKKFVALLLAVAVALCCACSNGSAVNSSAAESSEASHISLQSTPPSNNSPTPDRVQPSEPIDNKSKPIDNSARVISEEIILSLMGENLRCVNDIFICDSLPVCGEPLLNDCYQVDRSEFADFAQFENYIRSIYCRSTADMLLYDYPESDAPKYLSIDGMLCVDLGVETGDGAQLMPQDFTVEMTGRTDTLCEFRLICSNGAGEKFPLTGSCSYENGRWLLDEMIYR